MSIIATCCNLAGQCDKLATVMASGTKLTVLSTIDLSHFVTLSIRLCVHELN